MAIQTLEFTRGLFEMYDLNGINIGGASDVIGSISIDTITGQSDINFSSATPFYGDLWTAHDIIVQMVTEDTMKVNMLFDWGVERDISITVYIGIAFNADGSARFDTLDTDGDNILGYPMDNGPFKGFSAAFSGIATPANEVPIANDDNVTVDEYAVVIINVLDNDTDADGDNLTLTSASARDGSVSINADDTLTYTANPKFNGIDYITYTVSDGNGGTDTATVKLLVTTTTFEEDYILEGELSADSDDTENWHEVEFIAGEKYIYSLEADNIGIDKLKNAYIELRDESGNVVSTYEGLSDSVIGLVAPADGKYYLVVQSRDDEETGNYKIIARGADDHGASREEATVISFDNINDVITIAGGIQWQDKEIEGVPEGLKDEIPDHDEDWLSIALDQDDEKQFVTFDLESTDAGNKLKNATIEIFDPDNNLVARASGKDLDDGSASITLEALSTGNYTVRVTDERGSTGDYQLTATKVFAPINLDFDLDFEEEVEIEDSDIEINEADDIVKVTGDLLIEIDDPDIKESREEIGEHGTFSVDKVTKKYEFIPDDILKSAIFAGEKTIEISDVDALDAYIPRSSYKYTAVDKESSEYFEIELEDDIGNISTKTLRVEIKDVKDVSHSAKHDEIIKVGDISVSGEFDIHKIPVIAGNSYFVEVVSVADGITAPLKEAKMNLIGDITLSKSDGNSVSSMPSAVFEADEDGFVVVRVSSRTDIDAGKYAVRVIKLGLDGGDDAIDQIADYDANNVNTSSLLVGENRYGSLENSSDVDIIAVNLVQGQKTTIEVSSKGSLTNTHIQLLNSAGEVIAFAKSDYDLVAQIHAQVTESGTYFVKVNNARVENNKGDYLINIISQSNNDNWVISSSDGTVGLEGEESQWYIDQLSVKALNDEYTGAGVTINVVDTGVDYTHPAFDNDSSPINTDDDLNAYAVHQNVNYPGTYSSSITDNGAYDFDTSVGNMQTLFDSIGKPWHGTFVSGIIAADDNTSDFKGISHDVQIVSYQRGLLDSTAYIFNPINNSLFLDLDLNNLDLISNNSWNYDPIPFNDNFLEGGGTTAQAFGQAIQAATDAGVIFVFSAGNGHGSDDDVNYHNLTNSPLTIAVASVDRDGVIASSSTRGSAILVAAYGEEIYSTDIVGNVLNISLDSTNYAIQSGTSFAAPQVSAVIALMLEANDTLGYRDIQTILAHSATKTNHADVNYWQYNQSDNHNLGGMHFNDDMGFGIVNAYSAVRLAETWQNTISDESSLLLSGLTDTIDSTTPEVSKILTITDNINVEHAVLKVNLTHGNMKQLTIEITSPGDITTSKLMETPNTGAVTNFEFEFSSVQFYGENSAGNWTVTITDNTPGSGNGILNSLELTVYGSAIDNNDQYIFTDEFAAVGTVSVDDVGADWINASAVTSDVVVDLSLPSSLMSFNSIDQDISALTAVANIITGDGNDILTGDDGSNILNGGRGDDTIIYANSLSDYTVDFTSPDYVLVTKNLSSIADTLYSIENLSFAGELYQTFISSPDEDTPITINNLSFVLDGLTVAVATAANGTVTINTDDGTLNYQGNLNFNGADVITYTLSNDTSGTINVTVVPVNDAPVAADDAAETISNATVTINVLDNDTDIDYDNLSIVSATAPNGVVTINADNTLEYTSNPDFSGTDTITYTVDDGNGGSDTASVTVTVSPINAIIKTDDTNYLHNLTLNYWKDGVDTGVSTLVENGAINFGQALDFDMVKLSSIAYDSSNINVSDAVAMKLHAATLEQIDPSILTIGSDPFNTVIDPNSIYWHAADLNNDGAIDVADAVAIERHYAFPDTDLINTFDLVDSVTFERITSLDVGATEVGNWTIVANGDATQDDGSWLSGYTVDIV